MLEHLEVRKDQPIDWDVFGSRMFQVLSRSNNGVRLPSAKRALSSWLLAATISGAKRSAGLAQGVRSAQLLWSFDGSKCQAFSCLDQEMQKTSMSFSHWLVG